MKIVDRQTFLAMPRGTVFAKYQPCVFDDLCIKGETLPNGTDFFYQPIVDSFDVDVEFVNVLERSEIEGVAGAEIAMDFNCESRDGLYDAGQLFAVWSRKDVEMLIERLKDSL